MVEAVKWVDEIIVDAPYAIDKTFMATLFDDYKIDYIIHGDDPCLLPDGTDAYAEVRKAGRFKQVKRTEGVSSTDIVGQPLSARARLWLFAGPLFGLAPPLSSPPALDFQRLVPARPPALGSVLAARTRDCCWP